MFQVVNDTVLEVQTQMTTTSGFTTTQACGDFWPQTIDGYGPYTYYLNYPVYVCTDKTKKAIDILKHLQAKKKIRCDDVAKFIELVEDIAGLL